MKLRPDHRIHPSQLKGARADDYRTIMPAPGRASSPHRTHRPTSRHVDEPVKHSHTELQSVHRHSLVHAVEHAREVQLWRQPER